MDLAANKHKILKTKEIWEAPSEEEEKLMALQARFDEMKKKFSNKRKGVVTTGDSNQKAFKGSTKGKSNKKQRLDKPEWMSKEPEAQDLHEPREWNGAKWYYCCTKTGGKCDGVYRVHKPSECKGTAHKKGKSDVGKHKTSNEAFELSVTPFSIVKKTKKPIC